MAGRKSHLRDLHGIPGCHYDATVGWVNFDALDNLLELIDALASVVVVACSIFSTKVSPLEAINRTQVANLTTLETSRVEELTGAVAIPDSDVLCLQQFGIGGAFYKPEELLGNCAPKHSLGCEQRDLIAKIETHLSAKDADGANASAITTSHTYIK